MIDTTFSIYRQNVGGWELSPLAHICTEVRHRNSQLGEDNLLSLSYGRIVRKDIKTNEGLLPESFDGYNVVEAGDTVLRLTDLQNDKRSLRTGLVRERGIITSAYTTIRPIGVDARWLSYTLHSYDIQKIFYSLGSGLRQSMKFDDLKSLAIAVPPIEEQRRIADYLDEQVQLFQEIGEVNTSAIATFLEYKYALVRETVWGGREERNPLKVVPLRRLVTCLDGRRIPLNAEERYYLQGDIPYWGAGSIVDYVSQPIFNEELVLLGEDGAPFFDRGKDVAFYIDQPIWPNNHIHVLRPNALVSAMFLTHALNATDFGNFISGSTRDKLTQEEMMKITIPELTLAEQSKVCDHLAVEIPRMEDALSKLRSVAELFSEYQRTLITAAVTGEFDVSTGRSVA